MKRYPMPSVALTRIGPQDGGDFEFHWSGPYLKAHLLSDVGQVRKHNEDSCAICAPEDRRLAQERGVLLAVADGMGGASAGEFASRLSVQTITHQYYVGFLEPVPALLERSFVEANRRVHEEAEHSPQYRGMGTTASAVAIKGGWAYIAQVGDSRVYVLREGAPVCQVTEDHSVVAEQVRNGEISEEEARNHSLRNLITRAIGTREKVDVDLLVFRVRKGDTLLICSDGLSNAVGDEVIAESLAAANVQGAGRILVGKALENGARDNVTVAVARVTEEPPDYGKEAGAKEVLLPPRGLMGRIRRLLS